MNYINALYLAVLQGLTEFLPVSSSGHLVILQNILGVKKVPVLFDLILHLGTTAAVVLFYRIEIYWILKDLVQYLKYFNNSKMRENVAKRGNLKLLMYIIVANLITGVIGFLLADRITSFFYIPKSVSVFLLVTAVVLISTKFIKTKDKPISQMDYSMPVVVGLAQSFAMLPGISRSGSTISAAMFMGMERVDAGRFSFLISIPSILGASVFEYLKTSSEISGISNGIYIFAFFVSFIVGLLALKLLVAFLKKGKLYVFGIYCLIAGILSIIFI